MKITKKQLEEWYNSMSTKELYIKLGYRSPNSLYGLLKRAGIPLKGSEHLRIRNTVELIEDGE